MGIVVVDLGLPGWVCGGPILAVGLWWLWVVDFVIDGDSYGGRSGLGQLRVGLCCHGFGCHEVGVASYGGRSGLGR
jgi:hypothetical protein